METRLNAREEMIDNQKKRGRQRFWLVVGLAIMGAGCFMTISSPHGSAFPDWINVLILLLGVGALYMSACSKTEK
jgi:hypothetical protein